MAAETLGYAVVTGAFGFLAASWPLAPWPSLPLPPPGCAVCQRHSGNLPPLSRAWPKGHERSDPLTGGAGVSAFRQAALVALALCLRSPPTCARRLTACCLAPKAQWQNVVRGRFDLFFLLLKNGLGSSSGIWQRMLSRRHWGLIGGVDTVLTCLTSAGNRDPTT